MNINNSLIGKHYPIVILNNKVTPGPIILEVLDDPNSAGYLIKLDNGESIKLSYEMAVRIVKMDLGQPDKEYKGLLL